MRFLETVTLGEAFILIGGLLVILGIIRKAWPFIRRLVHMLDALDALPNRIEEMGAAVASVATLSGKVDIIHHEVTPNGGGSIKDEIRRQSETLARLDTGQLKLQAGQIELEATGKKRDAEIESVRTQLGEVRSEQGRVAERLAAQADALLGVLGRPAEEPPNTDQ